MVFVAVAEPAERPRVVADNHRVHAFGDGDLPGIVLAHPLLSATLAKSCTLGMLMPDGLPAEGAKNFAHGGSVRRSFEHLGRRHRGNPKLCARIASSPCARWPALVRRDLIEEVDNE